MKLPSTTASISNKCRSVLSAALLLALTFTMPGAHAQDQVRLRLDWTTLGYHAPFYYGVAKGIYDKAGIKLEIAEGKGSANVAQLAATGSDAFGFADATTVAQLVGRGLPAKVVLGVLRGTTVTMFYANDRGINSAQDMKGRQISVCPGDALAVYIPAYFKSVDIDPATVKQLSVDCSLKYTVVAQRQADAIMSYATAGKPLLEKVGVTNPKQFTPGSAFYLPSHGIVASNALIKSNPDLVKRFAAATTQAWLEAMKDPDGAVAAVMAAKPLLKDEGPTLKATLLNAIQYVNSPSTQNEPFGYQSPEDWRKALVILHEYTSLNKDISEEQIFTNAFVAK